MQTTPPQRLACKTYHTKRTSNGFKQLLVWLSPEHQQRLADLYPDTPKTAAIRKLIDQRYEAVHGRA
jgi:hypothetical protein